MKKNMAITFIGSLHLAMTPAKKGIIWLCLISVCLSCVDKNKTPDLTPEHNKNIFISEGKFHLNIEPAGEMPQIFYNISAQDLNKKLLVLKDKVRFSGYVVGAEDLIIQDLEDKNNSNNKAKFSDIIAIPTYNIHNILSPHNTIIKTSLNRDTSFSLDLIKEPYLIVLNPNGASDKAPLFFYINLNKNINHNFYLTNSQSSVKGRIAVKDKNLQVFIMQGKRLVSSVSTIDQNGDFRLELANPLYESTKKLALMLIIEPLKEDSPMPKVIKRIDLSPLIKRTNLGLVDLGNFEEPFAASLAIRGSDASHIGNAIIYLSAKVGHGTSLIKKQVNSLGLITFDAIFEGMYDIAIVPPTNSAFAMRVIKDVRFKRPENKTAGSISHVSIDLPKREPLSVYISDEEGNGIEGVQMEFARIGKMGDFATEDIFSDMLFKISASTNQDGRLCQREFGSVAFNEGCKAMLLDEGRYQANIIPPPGSKLAPHFITFDFPKENVLRLKLKNPQILGGKVVMPDQITPVKMAFVTVYSAKTSIQSQTRVMGNAITDEEGYFRVFMSGNY